MRGPLNDSLHPNYSLHWCPSWIMVRPKSTWQDGSVLCLLIFETLISLSEWLITMYSLLWTLITFQPCIFFVLPCLSCAQQITTPHTSKLYIIPYCDFIMYKTVKTFDHMSSILHWAVLVFSSWLNFSYTDKRKTKITDTAADAGIILLYWKCHLAPQFVS